MSRWTGIDGRRTPELVMHKAFPPEEEFILKYTAHIST